MLARRTLCLLSQSRGCGAFAATPCALAAATGAAAGPSSTASASSSTAAAAGASSSTTPAPSSVSNARVAAIFANRRNPTNLFQPGMHSGTLSDHPITLKVAKDELDYRQRKLIERGDYEGAADSEIEGEKQNFIGRDGIKETGEYRWVLFFVAAGYFTAHLTVYNYYYPDDMRLSYDPQRGYIDAIERKKADLESLDELVGAAVLHDVFDPKRAALKAKAQEHWAKLSGAAQ